MQIKASILRNAAAGGMGKISVFLFRLVQVPLLLSAFGVDEYGRWLVLASLPSWLTLANLGFGTVAANEMSMAVSAGDMARARNTYSTTLALIVTIVAVGGLGSVMIAPVVPWERLLGVSGTRHAELTASAIWLALTVLVSFSADMFGGRLRAAKKAHVALILSSFRPWLDFSAMFVALHYSHRMDHLALALFISGGIFIVLLQLFSWRAMPGLAFARTDVNPSRFRALLQKGLAFQAFPLGNALLFQGNLLVIQAVLGPAAVALFGTARTLVRSVNQMLELVNQVMWQELSHLLGAGDLAKAARLHRIGVGASVGIALVGTVLLAVFGGAAYVWWTGKTIELPPRLLFVFLLSIPFNALWLTSAVVHYASNQHEGLAVRYMAATILAVGACAVLAHYQGIEGAAISTLVADLALIPYVLKRSLVLTGDSWRGFFSGVATEFTLLPTHFRG